MRAAILVGVLALLQACAAPGPAPDAAALEPIPPKGAAVPDTASLDATRLPPPALEQLEVPAPARVQTLDRTTPPDDLWERIRRGFAIQDLDNALVHEKTAYYASRPEYLQRIFDRSRLYLFHIVEEAEKRGLPTEVALLPMVESAFNPMAYSRAHASGLWQFIPGTGRRYELTQNWWYDGRRDIVASTNAALEYLTKLYEMHGDWQLALASYNWGEGAVSRAVEKNRKAGLPTDYESLRMPAETRHYIPKLQALKNIIRDPAPFGITLDPIPNQPYFATYEKLRDIDVQLAAKLAEMPVDEFVALNPAFSRPVIRASMAPRIVLPADKVDVFHANLEKHQKALVSWKSYQPKKGDTLESIAKKHGMTVAQLKEVNGIPARSRAVPSMLVVPTSPATAGSHARLPLQYAPPIPVVYRRIWHTVKAGETLASIAARYGVSTLDLRQWNPGAKVSTGQRLAVDVKATARSRPQQGKPKAKPKPRVYKKAER